jgi:hypothetical protein
MKAGRQPFENHDQRTAVRFPGGEKPQHPAKIIYELSARFARRAVRFALISACFHTAVNLQLRVALVPPRRVRAAAACRIRVCLSSPIASSRMKKTA